MLVHSISFRNDNIIRCYSKKLKVFPANHDPRTENAIIKTKDRDIMNKIRDEYRDEYHVMKNIKNKESIKKFEKHRENVLSYREQKREITLENLKKNEEIQLSLRRERDRLRRERNQNRINKELYQLHEQSRLIRNLSRDEKFFVTPENIDRHLEKQLNPNRVMTPTIFSDRFGVLNDPVYRELRHYSPEDTHNSLPRDSPVYVDRSKLRLPNEIFFKDWEFENSVREASDADKFGDMVDLAEESRDAGSELFQTKYGISPSDIWKIPSYEKRVEMRDFLSESLLQFARTNYSHLLYSPEEEEEQLKKDQMNKEDVKNKGKKYVDDNDEILRYKAFIDYQNDLQDTIMNVQTHFNTMQLNEPDDDYYSNKYGSSSHQSTTKAAAELANKEEYEDHFGDDEDEDQLDENDEENMSDGDGDGVHQTTWTSDLKGKPHHFDLEEDLTGTIEKEMDSSPTKDQHSSSSSNKSKQQQSSSTEVISKLQSMFGIDNDDIKK